MQQTRGNMNHHGLEPPLIHFPAHPWPNSLLCHSPLIPPFVLRAHSVREWFFASWAGSFQEMRISAARCLTSDRCPCLAGRTAAPQSGNDLERAFDTRGHPPLHPPVTPSGGEGRGWREKGSPTLWHKLHHRRVIVRQAAVVWARPSEYDTSSICKQHHLNYGHLHI